MTHDCPECAALREQNLKLRDFIEQLGRLYLKRTKGTDGRMARGGLPAWMALLPDSLKDYWRGGTAKGHKGGRDR